jgi:hypothetical protein
MRAATASFNELTPRLHLQVTSDGQSAFLHRADNEKTSWRKGFAIVPTLLFLNLTGLSSHRPRLASSLANWLGQLKHSELPSS